MNDRKPTALIAVSDQTGALVYSAVLEMYGFSVITAADGFAAADIALSIRPALVVVDRLTSGLDGLSICRLLKARSGTARIPVLVLTSHDTPEERAAVIDSGADQVLVEPCAPELLACEARRLVQTSRAAAAQSDPGGYRRRRRDRENVNSEEPVR